MQLVFDLDGTLIDSSSGILGTLRHTFEVMGFELLPDAVTGVLGVEVYDGIPECLKALRDAGHDLHIATSKPEAFALRIFDNIGLRGYFTHICGAGLDGTRAKKAEVLEELFRRGGVEKPDARTLADWRMIGDRIYDMEGAAAFGMKSIGVTWGFGPVEEFAGAEAVAESPAALAELFMR